MSVEHLAPRSSQATTLRNYDVPLRTVMSKNAFSYITDTFFDNGQYDYTKSIWTDEYYTRACNSFLRQASKLNLEFLINLVYTIGRYTKDPDWPARSTTDDGLAKYDLTKLNMEAFARAPKTKVLLALKEIIQRKLSRMDSSTDDYDHLKSLMRDYWKEYTPFPHILEQDRERLIYVALNSLPLDIIESIKELETRKSTSDFE